MFTLKTSIELPIAHRLKGAYSGLCVGNIDINENKMFEDDSLGIIHGHNYVMTFEIGKKSLNEDGMVMDFKLVKKIIKDEMGKYDHAMILEKGDVLIDFYRKELKDRGSDISKSRLYIWPFAPTAENMAYKWYKDICEKLVDNGLLLDKLVVTVEETSHNSVSYTEE